jgi:SRSO17 transposase
MTLAWIAGLGRKLVSFLSQFEDCFGRSDARELLKAYVKGQLSSCPRKSVEPMALAQNVAPRTLQRFLESVQWDEEQLRDRTQQIVARDHADPHSLGIVDESGVLKSGRDTAGVARQWCGHTGKVDNCLVAVHLAYVAKSFRCLLDSDVYLPRDWADDLTRRRTAHIPDEVQFRTKPEIAQAQIRRALAHGVRVAAWTFDELYGRDAKFLDFLEQQQQVFVGEVPANFHGWVREPQVRTAPPPNAPCGGGRPKTYPRLGRQPHASEVQNLATHSPVFRKQPWQRFRVCDGERGPVVWEVKTARFWRRGSDGLPSRPALLIVARNVLDPQEVKYFVANRVPGEDDVTLDWLLWVAFRRWPVERVFREEKNEVGMDHFEVRGWRCLHRHDYVSALSHLFCARVRQEFVQQAADASDVSIAATHDEPADARGLSVEQVRAAMAVWLNAADLPPAARRRRYEKELEKMRYYQRRNAQASRSHTKTTRKRLAALGIRVDELPTCVPDDST